MDLLVVDVFFVISGFLMTAIIISGLENNSFSLWAFYLARARRIIPALIILCTTLLVLGWFWLPSADYKTLSIHAAAALGFFSNLKFWREAGYFDTASHENGYCIHGHCRRSGNSIFYYHSDAY